MTVAFLKAAIAGLMPAVRTQRLIELMGEDLQFGQLALRADSELVERDAQDEHGLSEGVCLAAERGLLAAVPTATRWETLVVDHLSPENLSRRISQRVLQVAERPISIAISGPSGIGKGTVARALRRKTPSLEIWSNGQIFRFLTYLCLQHGALTDTGSPSPSPVFAIADGLQYDPASGVAVVIGGQELRMRDVPSRHLLTAEVSVQVPAIARLSQGNVITVSNQAFAMAPHGRSFLVEGRRATLDYLNVELGIELAIRDRSGLGSRRVAQRVAALLESEPDESDEDIRALIDRLYR